MDERRMIDETRKLFDSLECEIDPLARAGSLRVGDQQLLEIAKALSLQTEILIMDEPTSALTEAEVARLDRVISRLRQRGVTILYISHKLDEVFRLADRITVLRDGRLVQTLSRGQTHRREITHLMVGREIEGVVFSSSRRLGSVILKVEQLSRPWPDHARTWRLKDISFELHCGEILGVAGLMGSGRTELLECLFGASAEPLTGQILLDDRVVRFRSPRDARRAGMAMVTEDRKRLGIFPQRVVRENISICTLRQFAPMGLVRAKQERTVTAQVLSQLGIRASGGDASIQSLSGGNQQKTILGRWLLTQPKVLLLDDPTRGIDVGAKAELYQLMEQLCENGLAIILTSSELPELLAICDRILVLAEGRLTATLSREEATEQKIMEAATAYLTERQSPAP
jgi:ABC-type sugar transport system ATPase subunit